MDATTEPAGLAALIGERLGEAHELLITVGFIFAFMLVAGRLWHVPVIGEKTLKSIIVSLAFALANMAFAPVAYFGSDMVVDFYRSIGVAGIDRSFWEPVPLWLLIPLGMFIYDFAGYWAHRFLHLPLFWPIHAIHHSDPDVNGFTTYRVHIFEPVFVMLLYTALLSWLGLPKEAMGLGAILIQLHNAYVHFNVDWGHGPLRKVIASPRFHRWHHADTPEFYGKNIANIFPVWDVLFGTYIDPGKCREPMGARGVPENDFVALLAYPLTEWRAMMKRAQAKRARHKAAEATPAE